MSSRQTTGYIRTLQKKERRKREAPSTASCSLEAPGRVPCLPGLRRLLSLPLLSFALMAHGLLPSPFLFSHCFSVFSLTLSFACLSLSRGAYIPPHPRGLLHFCHQKNTLTGHSSGSRASWGAAWSAPPLPSFPRAVSRELPCSPSFQQPWHPGLHSLSEYLGIKWLSAAIRTNLSGNLQSPNDYWLLLSTVGKAGVPNSPRINEYVPKDEESQSKENHREMITLCTDCFALKASRPLIKQFNHGRHGMECVPN